MSDQLKSCVLAGILVGLLMAAALITAFVIGIDVGKSSNISNSTITVEYREPVTSQPATQTSKTAAPPIKAVTPEKTVREKCYNLRIVEYGNNKTQEVRVEFGNTSLLD